MKRKKDYILLYSFGFLTVYTAYTTIVWSITGKEPPVTLTENVYKFWGLELAMLMVIVIFKIVWKQKKGDDNFG